MRQYNCLFITGIPAAGKSYLGKILAERTGAIHVCVDDIRESLSDDPKYRKWVDFYSDKDEKAYYSSTSAEERWGDLVGQSEALWPAILDKIKSSMTEQKPYIFESVGILPHLAKKDLDFPGVVLVGDSYESIVKRNKKNPRWGTTEDLQKMESKAFFEDERPRYIAEANRYGYRVFEKADDALPLCVAFLSSKKKDFKSWNERKPKIDNSFDRLFFHEREVWFSHMGTNVGFEQDGKGESFGRPVLIFRKFSNEVFWAIPLTTKLKSGRYYVPVTMGDGIERRAIISQLRLMDAKRLYQKLGVVDKKSYELVRQGIVGLCGGEKLSEAASLPPRGRSRL